MRFRGGVGEGASKGFQFGAPAVELRPNMIGADPKGRKERGASMRHKNPCTLHPFGTSAATRPKIGGID